MLFSRQSNYQYVAENVSYTFIVFSVTLDQSWLRRKRSHLLCIELGDYLKWSHDHQYTANDFWLLEYSKFRYLSTLAQNRSGRIPGVKQVCVTYIQVFQSLSTFAMSLNRILWFLPFSQPVAIYTSRGTFNSKSIYTYTNVISSGTNNFRSISKIREKTYNNFVNTI